MKKLVLVLMLTVASGVIITAAPAYAHEEDGT